MARFMKSRKKTMGQAPGSLVFVGKKRVEKTYIEVITFDEDRFEAVQFTNVDQLKPEQFNANENRWINVVGVHEPSVIEAIGKKMGFHSLLLEDIMNTGQSPKIDDGEGYFSLFLKMFYPDGGKQTLYKGEQLCFIFAPQYIMTFQEEPDDVFEPIRERISKHKGRIRNAKNDYLGYSLLDAVVDNYILIIEKIGTQIEDLEEEVMAENNPNVMEKIYQYKRELNYLRKSIRPAQETIYQLTKPGRDYFEESTFSYLNDLQDHIKQAAEAIETYRDMLSEQLNLYHSLISFRLNEIMKILTIFAAIFIPLTFIAGIYGTNFEYLPELKYKYSYFVFWGVLFGVAAGMLIYFKRKKWI